MRDHTLHFICAAKPCSSFKWFAYLSDIINHTLLDDEEKFLGCWLATQCMNKASLRCSFNYVQISQTLRKSTRRIHRILTRLRTMGFFICDIPIYYGEPTFEMVQKIHTFKLIFSRKFATETPTALVLPYRKNRAKINLNLINSNLKKMQEK